MKYRRFGKTELSMPMLTCGGMRFQHQWHDLPFSQVPAHNQKNLQAIVEHALELGINHFETARGYGSSEMQLGQILPRLPRSSFLVQTKVSPKGSRNDFAQTWKESYQHLGLEQIDLLALHGVNNDQILDNALKPGGALDQAEELKRRGLVRFVGFSTHAYLPTILRALQTGRFDFVNLHWYYVNPYNWPAIAEAHKRDMGVFIISPNDKGGKLYQAPPRLRELCAPLSPMQFNLLWVFSRPEVHTASIGAARPSDLDEHAQSIEQMAELLPHLPVIQARLEQELEDRLGAGWMQSWRQGLPSYDQAPGQVNIYEILRLWTYGQGLGLKDFAVARYNMLGGPGGSWFPGNKADQAKPQEIAQAVDKNPFASKIPQILQEAHRLYHAPGRGEG